jgi:hypothetical protein
MVGSLIEGCGVEGNQGSATGTAFGMTVPSASISGVSVGMGVTGSSSVDGDGISGEVSPDHRRISPMSSMSVALMAASTSSGSSMASMSSRLPAYSVWGLEREFEAFLLGEEAAVDQVDERAADTAAGAAGLDEDADGVFGFS